MRWRRRGRHDLANGGQGAGGVLADRGVHGGGLQGDGQSDGLVVVEQQWGQTGAGVQAITAGGSFEGRDRVAESA